MIAIGLFVPAALAPLAMTIFLERSRGRTMVGLVLLVSSLLLEAFISSTLWVMSQGSHFLIDAWTLPPLLLSLPMLVATPCIAWFRQTARTPGRRFVLSRFAFVASVCFVVSLFVPGGFLNPPPGKTRRSRARSDVANLGKAIARVRADTGNTSPGCLTDITANLPSSIAPPACSPDGGTLPDCAHATPGYLCWGGPYIPVVTNDPWNSAYVATINASAQVVTVISQGPDGAPSEDDVTFVQ